MFGCTKRFLECPVKLLCPVLLSVSGIEGQLMGIHTGDAMIEAAPVEPSQTAMTSWLAAMTNTPILPNQLKELWNREGEDEEESKRGINAGVLVIIFLLFSLLL